jgi:FkbM family methyltransferase
MNATMDILAWIGRRIGKPRGWERVVRLFSTPEKCRSMGDLCLERDGMMFLAQPGVPLGWHVAMFGTYEPEVREIFRSVLHAGGVAVDVGANVGWHTLLMARLVGDAGKVFAVEANAAVRKRLEDNIQLNRFGQIEVIGYAMAKDSGVLPFFGPAADDASSGDGHVVEAPSPGQRGIVHVESRSLDTVLSEARVERVDLVKIDVEGYEWPVLQGAERSIARFRPHVVFEYNTEYAFRGGGTAELIQDFFTRHGYKLFAVRRGGAEAVDLRNWPHCADIWAKPAN